MSTRHRFAREQRLVVASDDDFDGVEVEVLALLEHRCNAHNALCYGCSVNGTHVAICEEQLEPLSDKRRRALN